MSLKSLPILFINLGGEMIYILDQRLRAQNIPDDKAKKVLHDIITTVFSQHFMTELFRPQCLYSKKAMRTVFDRLAHASIMRLNASSMDKLYDLMTMAVKYQMLLCLRPKDILLVTLNHIDAFRSFVDNIPTLRQRVDHVTRQIIQVYSVLQEGEFQLIRQTVLNFFQDIHIRVSIFLKDKIQNSNGTFVQPTGGQLGWDIDLPGTIRLFNSSGQQIRTSEFSTGTSYIPALKEGSFDFKGDRVTKLGGNLYATSSSLDTVINNNKSKTNTSTPSSEVDLTNPNPLAKVQLDLLSHLIGMDATTQKPEFHLNLFNSLHEEEHFEVKPAETSKPNEIKIDASKKNLSELTKIMGELNVEDSRLACDGDDLLDLMDHA